MQRGEDLVIAKSRDMGASWMVMVLLVWFWQFGPLGSYLLGSRKEELVDGDSRSLMWKMEMLLEYQPRWLLPDFTKTRLHLVNHETKSSIDGESTNANFARGDRRTVVLMDEFAFVENGHSLLRATRDVTRCRLMPSTPNGTGNAFHDLCHPPSKIRRVDLHWTRHPEKAEGLSYDEDGNPTSPWYEYEKSRVANAVELAQELDINFSGSAHQYFDGELLQHLRAKIQQPYLTGDVSVDGFAPIRGGLMKLWCELGPDGSPSNDRRYVAGADIATGTGSSNSVLTIVDVKEGRKVAELVTPDHRPDQFADLAVWACELFEGSDGNGAFLAWERNGPGRSFGDRVNEVGYRNIYYRDRETGVLPDPSNTTGWTSTRESKLALLAEYRTALANDQYVNPSADAVDELGEYVYFQTGEIGHARSQSKEDPSGAKSNHGDRVIADALSWRAAKRRPWRDDSTTEEAPTGSYAWRAAQRRRHEKRDQQ